MKSETYLLDKNIRKMTKKKKKKKEREKQKFLVSSQCCD